MEHLSGGSSVATILPDLLNEAPTKDALATVLLSGDSEQKITKFPYETVLQPNQSVKVEKQSGIPLIFTSYATELITKKQTNEAFEISTNWAFPDNKVQFAGNNLTAGKPVNLEVIVKIKESNAEHIMIEIPIPASCSYASKPASSYWGNETYREYFKEKTVIFCEKLSVGTYIFSVDLLPRYTGKYTLNPAKVELMDLPVINANNGLRRVEVAE